MPKTKKNQKTQKRDWSPSLAVSERSTESAQATIEVEIHPSKDPDSPDDAEAAEPQMSQEGSIGDTPIPPTQSDPSKKRIKKVPVLFSQMKMKLLW